MLGLTYDRHAIFSFPYLPFQNLLPFFSHNLTRLPLKGKIIIKKKNPKDIHVSNLSSTLDLKEKDMFASNELLSKLI